MKAIDFINTIEKELNVSFYSGVPDSLLSPFTGELVNKYGISDKHIVAANEGNAVGLAAGYHLATGEVPCAYMQNSGQGNMVNPFASLMAPEVYKMPCVFVIGWRGEPGVKDEPQHVFQGEITCSLMELLKIESVVVSSDTTIEELEKMAGELNEKLTAGFCVAFIIKKGSFSIENKPKYSNPYELKREDAIRCVVECADDLPIISTTGKASRELFEIREQNKQSHQYDFLTVGSMGHSSSIALAVALQKSDKKVICVDGDGAMLMHMGSMALMGTVCPANLIHILLNNEAHETVGGMPTVAGNIDAGKIAEACGYQVVYKVDTAEALKQVLREALANKKLTFIEVCVALGAREDLGRPTTTAIENKEAFMKYLRES